jgi:hypothetical protein
VGRAEESSPPPRAMGNCQGGWAFQKCHFRGRAAANRNIANDIDRLILWTEKYVLM